MFTFAVVWVWPHSHSALAQAWHGVRPTTAGHPGSSGCVALGASRDGGGKAYAN
jgi:hypothetical protein